MLENGDPTTAESALVTVQVCAHPTPCKKQKTTTNGTMTAKTLAFFMVIILL